MRKLAIAALCTTALWAQNPNTAVYPGAVATDTDLLAGENLVQSPLTADITAASTTLPVANAGIFRVPTAVIIDSEIIKVCSKDTVANTLTVCSGGRGFDRTTAGGHASGTMVRATIAAHYHNQVAAEIKAIENTLGANLSNVRTTIDAVGGASNLDTVGRVPFTSATGIVNKSTLHFDSTNQRFGLGVTAPHEKLDVLGRLKFRSDGSATAGFWLNDVNGNGDLFVGQTSTTASAPFGVWHTGAWRFRIRSDGNVGINVADPIAKFHVSGPIKFETNFSGQGAGFGGVTHTFTWPSPRGTNLYHGYRFDIQDDLLDGSSAIAVYNTGTADGIFIEARGHSTGSTSPTGLAVSMNKIGTSENNPNYSGYGIQIWDYTSAANPGSPLLVRNTVGGTRRLAQFQNTGNGPTIIELFSGNTADQESIFRFQDRTGATQWDFGKNASNNLIFRTGGGATVAEIRSDRLTAPLIDSGGTVVHVKSYGAVGDGVTDDTTAWQNALNAVAGTGKTLVCGPGTYKTTASLSVSAGNFTIQGPCTIKPTFSGTSQFSAITWSGSTGATTTVTANVNTDRANSATDTISVASTTGFAADDYVYLLGSQTTGTVTNYFAQVVRVKSVGASSLTFYTPVVIPIRTTDASSVTKVTLLSNITLRDLTFDGANVTAPNTDGVAIRASYYKDSVFENLTFLNWKHGGASNTSAAIVTWVGLNNRHRNISIRDSGSGNMSDYHVWNETALMTTNLSSIEATGFGPQWTRCTHCIVDGVTVLSAGQKVTGGRGLKTGGVAWSRFSNLYVARSKYTGISITGGTYRTVFSNISAVQNENEGIWFSQEDNIYNTLLGVNSIGNVTADLIFYSSDKLNAALILQAGTITSNDTNFVAQMRDGGWQAINFGTKPTCSASVRGMTWFTQGASGVKDAYEVCAKDATNAYAWRTIY
jgi:hypothetical protein